MHDLGSRRSFLQLLGVGAWDAAGSPLPAAAASPTDYERARGDIAAERLNLAARFRRGEHGEAFRAECERALARAVLRLARFWVGTRWGLGQPQIERPGDGRVNCGTFVGRLLADAGFDVYVRKLQRQPSELIARTFAAPDRIRRFSRMPIERVVAAVNEMGPGLFVIGLDLHAGLLVRADDDLHFVHASIVTGTAVDEPASSAILIQASAYVVVGKLLGGRNLEQWLFGLPVPVIGGY